MKLLQLLHRLLEAVRGRRTIGRGDEIEHWTMEECDEERTRRGITDFAFGLTGKTEAEAIERLGQPASIEKPSLKQYGEYGRLIFEADCGLVFDHILRRSRIVLHVADGRIHSARLMPKLKRCPSDARRDVGSYYAPE